MDMKLQETDFRPSGGAPLVLERPSFRPKTVEVVTPSTPEEWSAAREIVAELFAWLAAQAGVQMTTAQEDAAEELDDLARCYSEGNGRFFVAKLDGEAVGTTGVKVIEPGVAEIKRVYVRPAARGYSLASLLMDWALEAARELGAERVVLETAPGFMQTAVAMYHSYGFRETAHYSDLATHVTGLASMELSLA